jgi:hypothetical protein
MAKAQKPHKPGLCQEVEVDEGLTLAGPGTVLVEKIGRNKVRLRTIAHRDVGITRVKVRRNVTIEDVTKQSGERT